MKTYLDCIPCFLRQTLVTARIATEDERKIREALDKVCILLPKISLDATPPEIGREVYRTINRVIGIEDPYYDIKKEYTRYLLTLYPDLKKRVASSSDPLLSAVKLAIAGNIIDFAPQSDFDIEKEIEKAFNYEFAIFDYAEFKGTLQNCDEILYLADNAGETVMDRILIEEMGKPVKYAVKEKAIINDATFEDAVDAGIHGVAEVVSTGCDAPGTVLKYCSEDFLNVYKDADVIISKGQGNYEALSGEERPIFFLLKTKCPIIARDLGVESGDIILQGAPA
ncbi:hypothetical protein CH333_08115 [candidate division WOR-3 bacterium JGI_Cruoil_03_44_89]|uniref:Damage-control phosphatase ARMT1-like metal-binding domain-containing protein n=1 Tax=candidate division WOR-3 bacterium JGI_Cruoil_03_44_89 TaxID=1973748 RepID=A0A235BS59_UNCW3|nr:MAG: hypothetical protein CH333_08115 [candidate division WOR-3 bacterium JGI_Cruoil_03_44_89]